MDATVRTVSRPVRRRCGRRTVSVRDLLAPRAAPANPPRSGARWGELVALSRDRLDLEHGTMTSDRQYVDLRDGSLVLDTPKSAAGVRTVHSPPHPLPELSEHLEQYRVPRR